MLARLGRDESGIGGPDNKLWDKFRWESLKIIFLIFFIFCFRCFEGMGGPNNNIRNLKINLNNVFFYFRCFDRYGGTGQCVLREADFFVSVGKSSMCVCGAGGKEFWDMFR